MFTVKALGEGKLDIHLASSYMHDLKLMIVNSDNDAAGRCIHGLGFAYLNGVLEDGGFFNSKDKKGVWAAGDFHHGWTPVPVPCGNLAVGTAQGATTETMARLMDVIVLGDVFASTSQAKMTDFLQQAANGSDSSFLIRDDLPVSFWRI